ncbi:MAG: chaperonin GroEL [Chloroflexi bacterium]|nr:chaperonin GroEL [Chloroflexota bacterium]MDA1228195.1 chaperonin GroEL [Chloroflexota bacterium]
MAKQFQFQQDAWLQLMVGVDTLARAVGVTLGPSGRNVVLAQDFGPPQVCSDGVTIAKEIELKKPFENMGAQLVKVAASKTNDVVGDGTTTSTILAQHLLRQGFKNMAAGANPMDLKKGIDKAVAAIREEILGMSRIVEGRDNVAQVAVLAAHEEEMGNLIADVLEKVGKTGVITVEESKGIGYEVEYVEGMQIDRGYLSPYFVTDQNKMVTEVEDPYILLTTEKISAMSDLIPLLESLSPTSRNIVIVAEDVDGEALATLVVNKIRGNLNALAVKAPGFGDRRKAIMEDMAILFGATVISKDIGRGIDSATIEDLGRCRRIVSNKDETTFIEGVGNQVDIHARIGQIRQQAGDTSSDYDREKLEERAAKMAGGVAVLRVGAVTEIELREKRQRVEDALAATRAAMEEGIVPGGGTALVRAAKAARGKLALTGDELTGANITFEALTAPLMLISDNAGYSGVVVLDDVQKGEGDYGFDAEAGKFGSMYEMGIVDPTKVVRASLENAASVAGMMLTTDSIMTELNPMKLPAPYDD